jgi:release factor glutamine methyltransferase
MILPFDDLITALTPRYGAVEARSIARIVLEDAFGTKQYAIFQLKEESGIIEYNRIKTALIAGIPLQYILGVADFFGLKFKVTPAVLIPRQETEELVDWMIQYLKKQGNTSAQVLDIGLGSGCIGITLKRKLPDIELYGIEKSNAALTIALENAHQILGDARLVHFKEADILTDNFDDLPMFDVIVSNPPYIPRHEATVMPEHVLEHEPELALFVEGDDPLLFYRVILQFAQQHLKTGAALFFECNEFNAGEVVGLLKEVGMTDIMLQKDIGGADRMVMGRR